MSNFKELFLIPEPQAPWSYSLYLPPDFNPDSHRRYPLAYVINKAPWRLHDLLDARSSKAQVPIVLSLHHANDQTLSPWPLRSGADEQACGATLLKRLIDELHPQVLATLPVLRGPQHTLIGGRYAGGLLALHAALKHSCIFGQAICLSPSLGLADGMMAHQLDKLQPSATRRKLRLYIDACRWEGRLAPERGREADEPVFEPLQLGDDPCHDAALLIPGLEAQGLVRGYHFNWDVDRFAPLGETRWQQRLAHALDFIYGPAGSTIRGAA